MLDEPTRRELARAAALLPTLPRQRVGPKTRLTARQHYRIVRLGEPSRPVFIKSYSVGQCALGLDRIEHYILQTLRDSIHVELPFLVPEPICLLEDRKVLATTVIPGWLMRYRFLLYGITRIRTRKLLDWSSRLGHGLAVLQRATAGLDLDPLPRKELASDAVQKKVPSVRVLVDAGFDRLVAERAFLLDETPQRLAHGDLSPGNILVDRDTIGLVDWGLASVRSVFHDPLHLARAMLFSQGRGIGKGIATAMATAVIDSWMRAADLPHSSTELSAALKLELCRAYCADGVDERIVNPRPKLAAELISIVSRLNTRAC
jgi:hypothetical protein